MNFKLTHNCMIVLYVSLRWLYLLCSDKSITKAFHQYCIIQVAIINITKGKLDYDLLMINIFSNIQYTGYNISVFLRHIICHKFLNKAQEIHFIY